MPWTDFHALACQRSEQFRQLINYSSDKAHCRCRPTEPDDHFLAEKLPNKIIIGIDASDQRELASQSCHQGV